MSRVFILVMLLLNLHVKSGAQHCPLDGGHIIIIKMVDSLGQPVNDPKYLPCLSETENPDDNSCGYTTGRLSLPFDDLQHNLVEKYQGHWKTMAIRLLEHSQFKEPGFFCVVLTQDELRCQGTKSMVSGKTVRSFEIRLINKKGDSLFCQVPAERIYSLCTRSGSWSRIQPFEFVVKE